MYSSLMNYHQIGRDLVISMVGSGLAGLIVGWIFEKRSVRANERLRTSLLNDFAPAISSEVLRLSTVISEQISNLANHLREQISSMASATERISDGIDALVQSFRER